MGCYTYNCQNVLGDHTLNDCENEVPSGFVNLILLNCDHQLTDASNGTLVNAEITAGRATLIRNIKAGVPAASANTVASNIANAPDKVARYALEVSVMDGNINDANMTFYNTLFSGTSFGGLILHNEEESVVLFYNNELRGQGSLVAPDNNGEFMRYEYTLSMNLRKDAVLPEYSDEPSGVF